MTLRANEFARRLEAEFPEIAGIDPSCALASNVDRLRKDRGLTQELLAEAIGVRPPRIAAVERGESNPRLDTLEKLAGALGVPVHALLDPDYLDRPEEPPATAEYRRTPSRVRRVAEPGPRPSE
ncbi:MAG TPA: helix-turn-helix transcriptional regulator [Gemmatimonadales bacterium]|nr:helix-turn-helix transcriptional regulator [Gemmatimonadales bacterium]